MMWNKLIGKSLAYKKQKIDRQCAQMYMQISYACVVLLFYSQHIRKIRNGIFKDS